jgi:hypothetical protein
MIVPLAGLWIFGGVFAAEGDQYMVEMALWIDGEQRGTPILVVPPGERAAVEVSDEGGEAGWRIELLVKSPAASEGAPTGAIWLDLAVHERVEGQWELVADSLLGVPEGQTSSMSVVDPGVETGTRENSRVYLTAQASLLRPGDSGP